MKLLSKLDAVESGGDSRVRKARKALAKDIAAVLEGVDAWKVEEWKKSQVRAQEPAQEVHISNSDPQGSCSPASDAMEVAESIETAAASSASAEVSSIPQNDTTGNNMELMVAPSIAASTVDCLRSPSELNCSSLAKSTVDLSAQSITAEQSSIQATQGPADDTLTLQSEAEPGPMTSTELIDRDLVEDNIVGTYGALDPTVRTDFESSSMAPTPISTVQDPNEESEKSLMSPSSSTFALDDTFFVDVGELGSRREDLESDADEEEVEDAVLVGSDREAPESCREVMMDAEEFIVV